jgi:DNA-binding protein HU-beta
MLYRGRIKHKGAMRMNKQELISKIAEKSNLSKKNAAAALTALIDTITKALKAEGKLAIPNLGTFQVKEHAARTGHNPRTGETVEIAAKKVPAFKPAKALKDAIE